MTFTVNTAGSPPKKAADVANDSGRDVGFGLGDPLTALSPPHVSGGKEQARSDLVRCDLDLGTVLTILGLPTALLQAARDHHSHPLGK